MAGNSAGAYNSIPVNFAKNPGRQRKILRYISYSLSLSLYHSVGCGFWPKARMASMVKLAAITTVARTPASGKYNNCVDRRGNATLPTNKPRYKPRNKNAATMTRPREPTGVCNRRRGLFGGIWQKSGNQSPTAVRTCNDNRQQLQSKMAEHKNSGMKQSNQLGLAHQGHNYLFRNNRGRGQPKGAWQSTSVAHNICNFWHTQ